MKTRELAIAQWQEREREIRALLAEPGVATINQLKSCTRMEFLQRIWRGELPSVPIGKLMDFVPVEGEPGRIVL